MLRSRLPLVVLPLLVLPECASWRSCSDDTWSSPGGPLANWNFKLATQMWCCAEKRAEAEAVYGPLASWNVGAVTDMTEAFAQCYDLVDHLQGNTWDTSSVTDMTRKPGAPSALEICALCPGPQRDMPRGLLGAPRSEDDCNTCRSRRAFCLTRRGGVLFDCNARAAPARACCRRDVPRRPPLYWQRP